MPPSARKRTTLSTGGEEGRKNKVITANKLTHPPANDQEAYERIPVRLGGEREGKGWICFCPAHDNTETPALAVNFENGKLLWYCFGGCTQEAVREALAEQQLLAVPPRSVAAPKGSYPDKLPPADGLYTYRDESGQILCIVGRVNAKKGQKKKFWCSSYWSDDTWRLNHPQRPKPIYGLDRVATSPDAPVLICEGEKKADAATSMSELSRYVCLSWMGGADAVDKTNWSPLHGRDVTIWPDNDQPGFDAADAVARCCLEAGAISVRVVQLPEGLDEGWDLADPVPDEIELDILALVETAKPWEESVASDDPFRRYVWATLCKCFYDTKHRQMLDETQINNEHGHVYKRPPLSKRLIGSTKAKKVRNITYWPGKEAFVVEDGYEKLNTWLPETTAPREGNVDVLLDYLQFLFPDSTERNYAVQWMAYQLQQPGQKIHWVLLVVGAMQGSGKSTLFQIMRRLLGTHNTKDISGNKQLWDYTGWMQSVQLVAVEEVKSGKKWEEANRIKSFITAPTIFINEKYVVAFEQPNRVNFYLSSNFEDEAMPLEDHDRRFLVLAAPDEVRDPEYYSALYAWIDQPANIAAMKHYLLKYSLQNFPAKSPAPMTAAKQRLIHSSKSQVEQYLRAALDEVRWPLALDIISLADLEHALPFEYRKYLNSNKLAEIITRLGGKKLSSQVPISDGSKPWLWIIRNHEKWDKVKNAKIGREYDAPLEGGTYASQIGKVKYTSEGSF